MTYHIQKIRLAINGTSIVFDEYHEIKDETALETLRNTLRQKYNVKYIDFVYKRK